MKLPPDVNGYMVSGGKKPGYYVKTQADFIRLITHPAAKELQILRDQDRQGWCMNGVPIKVATSQEWASLIILAARRRHVPLVGGAS